MDASVAAGVAPPAAPVAAAFGGVLSPERAAIVGVAGGAAADAVDPPGEGCPDIADPLVDGVAAVALDVEGGAPAGVVGVELLGIEVSADFVTGDAVVAPAVGVIPLDWPEELDVLRCSRNAASPATTMAAAAATHHFAFDPAPGVATLLASGLGVTPDGGGTTRVASADACIGAAPPPAGASTVESPAAVGI